MDLEGDLEGVKKQVFNELASMNINVPKEELKNFKSDDYNTIYDHFIGKASIVEPAQYIEQPEINFTHDEQLFIQECLANLDIFKAEVEPIKRVVHYNKSTVTHETVNGIPYDITSYYSSFQHYMHNRKYVEFTFPEKGIWSVDSARGDGLCLPRAIFTNLRVLSGYNPNLDADYSDGSPSRHLILGLIIMVGLKKYFLDGKLTYSHGSIHRIWTLEHGKKFFVIPYGDGDNILYITYDDDVYSYFQGGQTNIIGPTKEKMSSLLKPISEEELLKKFLEILNIRSTLEQPLAKFFAKALGLNILTLVVDKFNNIDMRFDSENQEIERYSDFDGIYFPQSITTKNSIILLRDGGAHYKRVGCTEIHELVERLRKILKFQTWSSKYSNTILNAIININGINDENYLRYVNNGVNLTLLVSLTLPKSYEDSLTAFENKIKPKHSQISAIENSQSMKSSDLQKLIDMGFTEKMATEALIANENVDEAIASLLAQGDQGFADVNPVFTQPLRGNYAHGDLSAMKNIKHSSEDMRDEPMREANKKMRERQENIKKMRKDLEKMGYDDGVDLETAIMEENTEEAIKYLNSQGIKPITPELLQLLEMGFPEAASRDALLNANNDVNDAYEILSSQPVSATPTKSTRIDIGNSTNPPNQSPENLRDLRMNLFNELTKLGFSNREANAMTDIRGLFKEDIKAKLDRYNNLIKKGFNKKIVGEKKLVNNLVVDETILSEIERELNNHIFQSMVKKLGRNCGNIDTLSSFLDENDIEHDVRAIEREMFLQKGYDPGDIDEVVKIYNNCEDVDKFLSELKEIRLGSEIGQLFDFVDNDEDGYIKAISLLEGKNIEQAKQFVRELNKQRSIILGIKAHEEVKNFRKTLKSINPEDTIPQEFIDTYIQDYYDKNKEKYRKAIYATYKKNGNRFLDTEQFMTANRLAGGKPRKSRRKIRNKSKRKNRNKSRSKQLKPRQKTGRVKYRRTRKH